MKLLLDTNALLWIAESPERLSIAAHGVVTTPENDVFISSISMWEICQKIAIGKLSLSTSPQEMVRLSCENLKARFISFDVADCYYLHTLPPIHRDPFDRMLICQAIQNNLTIVTPDKDIRQYPIATLW